MEQLFIRMTRPGKIPDHVVCSAFITIVLEKGKTELAQRMLRHLESENVVPKPSVYSEMVIAHSLKEDLDSAVLVQGEAEAKNIPLNRDAYTALASVALRLRGFEAARAVYERMEQKTNLRLDEKQRTYFAEAEKDFISGEQAAHQDGQTMKEMLHVMQEFNRTVPNMISYRG